MTPQTLAAHQRYALAAIQRSTGALDAWTTAYFTDGGTWMLASTPASNDDGKPHDVIAVLPAPIAYGESRVIPMRATVNPNLVDAMREILDSRERTDELLAVHTA